MSVKIFFCYAHEDEALLKQPKAHLLSLERQKLIALWHDRDINAGTDWEREINEHLNAADIILLLISPDFMNSDYCYGVEMQKALARHQRGEARVIPIILRYVYWQGIIGNLSALPTDAKPVKSWSDIDEAFFNVAEGIRKVVKELNLPLASQEAAKRLLVKEEKPVSPLTDFAVNIKTYLEQGKQALAKGEVQQAVFVYEQAIQLKPDNPQAYLGLAEASLTQGSFGVVYTACRKVQELQAEGGLESKLAQALLNLLDRRYGDALQNIDNVINSDSRLAYAHALRAYLLRLTKRYYDAERAEARAALLSYGGRFENNFPPSTPEPL